MFSGMTVLQQRILTGLLLLLPSIAIIYIGGPLLVLLALIVMAAACYEFYCFATALERHWIYLLVGLNVILPLSFLAFGFFGFAAAFCASVITAFILIVSLVELRAHQPDYGDFLPPVLLGFCYVGLLGSTLVIVAHLVPGVRILWLLLAVISADTAAYFGGSFFGGKKLAPRISPNKTISGLLCGLLAAVVAAALFDHVLKLGFGIEGAMFGGFLIAVLAAFGDLSESLIKRCFGVKDSGSILPGHGGF